MIFKKIAALALRKKTVSIFSKKVLVFLTSTFFFSNLYLLVTVWNELWRSYWYLSLPAGIVLSIFVVYFLTELLVVRKISELSVLGWQLVGRVNYVFRIVDSKGQDDLESAVQRGKLKSFSGSSGEILYFAQKNIEFWREKIETINKKSPVFDWNRNFFLGNK
jgi:hypothetical protein